MAMYSQRRRFEIQGPEGYYTWILKSANGVALATSWRSFETEAKCRAHIKLTRRTMSLAGVIVK